MEKKVPLNSEERKISDAFNQARISKIRDDVKKWIAAIHEKWGTAQEVFKVIHEGNLRIQLILNNS